MRIGLAGAGRIGMRHAETLRELPEVDAVVVADADPGRALQLAGKIGAAGVPADSVDALFESDLDGLVVAATTAAHTELVRKAAKARLPVFCEKPLAPDARGTEEVVSAIQEAGIPVQVGFQRRFDTGHRAVRDAVRRGELGWLHTIRSCTFDPSPPPAEYIPTSGGLFRDCLVHDIDAARFVTGREVTQVVAVGANRGDAMFAEADDVDTCSAVLTLDDGTIAVMSATRYNAAGYDVRFEAFGSADSLGAGFDEHMPLTPAGGNGDKPSGPAYTGFLQRFADAYAAEVGAFTDMVAGRGPNPCPPEEALEAFYVAEACELSRRENRAVSVEEMRA